MRETEAFGSRVLFDEVKRVYVYEQLVLLNETSAAGGVVYFSNFIKWQGIARGMNVILSWK